MGEKPRFEPTQPAEVIESIEEITAEDRERGYREVPDEAQIRYWDRFYPILELVTQNQDIPDSVSVTIAGQTHVGAAVLEQRTVQTNIRLWSEWLNTNPAYKNMPFAEQVAQHKSSLPKEFVPLPGITPEQQQAMERRIEDAEMAEMVARGIITPPVVETSAEVRETKLEALVALLNDFEKNHSLEELNALVGLDITTVANHPIRKPAKDALMKIEEQVSKMSNKLPPEVEERCYAIRDAVGYFDHGTYTHSRNR